MNKKAHILIVDDDEAILDLFAAYLVKGGYAVSVAADAGSARAILRTEKIDVVLLDLNLPDANGMVLAREMMNKWNVRIIMVTERIAPEDRADGLELGADDYLPKPVFPRELLARLSRVLSQRPQNKTDDHLAYRFEGWALDVRNRSLLAPDRQKVELTPAEFDLLAALVKHAGFLQTREQLIQATGGADGDTGVRSIDILVSRLRRKLGFGEQSKIIETCRGHGYRFGASVTRDSEP